MGQSSQSPDRGTDGSFLNQTTTSGRKIDFLQQTATGSGSVVVAANSLTAISFSATLYDPLIPTAARTTQNILTRDQCIVWWYPDFFVDTNNDFNYELYIGASLSGAQKTVALYSQWDELTPGSGSSQRRIIQIGNGDTNPHTLYYNVKAKYIITS